MFYGKWLVTEVTSEPEVTSKAEELLKKMRLGLGAVVEDSVWPKNKNKRKQESNEIIIIVGESWGQRWNTDWLKQN